MMGKTVILTEYFWHPRRGHTVKNCRMLSKQKKKYIYVEVFFLHRMNNISQNDLLKQILC